jgi:hypothetical protein
VKISLVRCSTSEAWVVDDDLWDLIEVYAPTVDEFLTGLAALPPSRLRGFGRRGRRDRRGRRHGGAAAAPGRRADAIDGIRAALESRLAELEKSAQRGRLAQQH